LQIFLTVQWQQNYQALINSEFSIACAKKSPKFTHTVQRRYKGSKILTLPLNSPKLKTQNHKFGISKRNSDKQKIVRWATIWGKGQLPRFLCHDTKVDTKVPTQSCMVLCL